MSGRTLQSCLSRQVLLEMAGDRVYGRGRDYYDQDHVVLLAHTTLHAVAEVEGSMPYRVEWSLRGKAPQAECTCPAMSDYGFCKHAVAFGLFLIDAPPPSGRKKPGKRTPDEFARKYPNISGWIRDGWIEIGRCDHAMSRIRVLDEGGLVWEGGTRGTTIDSMLEEAERAIVAHIDG